MSGGTFSKAVPEELCAEGYQPKDNGNGTYSFRQPSSKVTIKVNFVKEAAKVEAPVKANPETGAPNHYFACR